MIILGIDPGFAITGYGVIKKEKDSLELIDHGAITTKAGVDFCLRLKDIHTDLQKIIERHRPDVAAVEQLFFCKNVTTALNVGHARGVALLTLGNYSLPIHEYTPMQVKQAITSYGGADKKQVQEMVKLLLKMRDIPKPDDAADALAIAICCANSI